MRYNTLLLTSFYSQQTALLERDVRELLEQLKSLKEQRSPTKQVMFMSPSVPVQPTETTKTDEEEPSKPDWQTVMMEEHRVSWANLGYNTVFTSEPN